MANPIPQQSMPDPQVPQPVQQAGDAITAPPPETGGLGEELKKVPMTVWWGLGISAAILLATLWYLNRNNVAAAAIPAGGATTGTGVPVDTTSAGNGTDTSGLLSAFGQYASTEQSNEATQMSLLQQILAGIQGGGGGGGDGGGASAPSSAPASNPGPIFLPIKGVGGILPFPIAMPVTPPGGGIWAGPGFGPSPAPGNSGAGKANPLGGTGLTPLSLSTHGPATTFHSTTPSAIGEKGQAIAQ